MERERKKKYSLLTMDEDLDLGPVSVKEKKPSVRIYGVQTEAAPAMSHSFKAGEIVHHPVERSLADGIAVRRPGERTFEHILTEKQIEEYRGYATVYLINYQITLPAARRELASGEWLPRAREA